jgi:hypothetical protein
MDTSLRYLYCPGVKTREYIFNWDNARHWKRLSLVENTFNAMWLRNYQYTTNFGSHMSEAQAQLIAASAVESVVLVWDENAEREAEKAVNLLQNKFGIPAAYVKISGQPDDHPKEMLLGILDQAHEVALTEKKVLESGW